MSVNMRCIITVLIMKKGHVSNSQNVKDSLHGNKRLRKIIINLRIKVEICISTYSNADIVCYRATWRTELNKRNSVRLIVDRTHTRTHTCLPALFPGLSGWAGTRGKPNLDFTEARDSESQWHQLGHMQVCTSLQTDNHASTHHSVFTGRMPFLPPNQQRQSTEDTM